MYLVEQEEDNVLKDREKTIFYILFSIMTYILVANILKIE